METLVFPLMELMLGKEELLDGWFTETGGRFEGALVITLAAFKALPRATKEPPPPPLATVPPPEDDPKPPEPLSLTTEILLSLTATTTTSVTVFAKAHCAAMLKLIRHNMNRIANFI